jgi:hypothetical protein
MRNNDIMDEDYGKEVQPQFVEAPWSFRMLGVVITACIAAILLSGAIRLCKWIIG